MTNRNFLPFHLLNPRLGGLYVITDERMGGGGMALVYRARDERLERMTMLIAEQHGYARQRHLLVISGICDQCRAR